MTAVDIDPVYFELWVRFRELSYIGGHAHDNFAGKLPYRNWLPPECPEAFTTQSTSNWHIWSPGQMKEQSPDLTHGLPPFIHWHETTSMFYSTEIQSFFEVPCDCGAEHVSARKEQYEEDGWNRLTFAEVPGQRLEPDPDSIEPLTIILGHALDSNQIIDCNLHESWEEILLPSSFVKGLQDRGEPPTCALAGKLSMIFGLLAFATSPEDVVPFISATFRPNRKNTSYIPTWLTGRAPYKGLINRRGVVVDIAFDTRKYTRKHINSWEAGLYGPILSPYDLAASPLSNDLDTSELVQEVEAYMERQSQTPLYVARRRSLASSVSALQSSHVPLSSTNRSVVSDTTWSQYLSAEEG